MFSWSNRNLTNFDISYSVSGSSPVVGNKSSTTTFSHAPPWYGLTTQAPDACKKNVQKTGKLKRL